MKGVLLGFGVWLLWPTVGSAQAVAPLRSAGLYLGPATCGGESCHGATRPRRTFPVLQNELYTWLHRDRHARAFEVLFDRRSATISKNLGLGKASEAKVCLACHTTPAPDATEGVSCESCHGPASGWRDQHTTAGWRHQDSVAAGMINLRDPMARARVCLDCHQGGPGRNVTHDLLAAGHPVLRFELDNFAEAMPAHWRPAGERGGVGGAQAWALGQVVALEERLEKLARDARSGPWPDFVHLRCASCHHGLEQERWQLARASAPGERLGLPPWDPAPWAVLRLLLRELAPAEAAALEPEVSTLARQLRALSTPAEELAATAERLRAPLGRARAAVASARFDDAQLQRLLKSIAAERVNLASADVPTAEQAVFAVHALVRELIKRDPRRLEGGLVRAVTALAREVRSERELDGEKFARLLARIETEVPP